MRWIVPAVLCALGFAAVAAPLRRRFGRRGLVAAAVLIGLLALSAGAMTMMRTQHADDAAINVLVLAAAVVGAAGGGAAAVERVLHDSSIPDPVPEAAAAAIGFLGGAMLGAATGVLLIGVAFPRIG